MRSDLAALGLVGGKELRPAPALQCGGKLPGEIDGVADAAVHAEPAGRDHELDRIAGHEHTPLAVMVGEQQVLLPRSDIERIELERHRDRLLKLRHHVGIAVDDRMQREMPGRVLHDELGRMVVGDVIVAALADRDALEQLFAVVQRLAQLQHAVFVAGELDAELPAHRAVAAIAAGQIERVDLGGLATEVADRGRDRACVLRKGEKLAAIAHGHARQAFRHLLEQRLDGVLRNELIGLERQAAVVRRSDLLLGLRDRRIGKLEERRLNQRQHDEHIHRDVAREPGGADLFGEPHAPENLHAARIHALHLGEELRRLFLLDEHATHTAQAEIDREREPNRAGTNDEDLGIH